MKDERPECPKCGCPAREVVMIAKVFCALNLDGTVGKVRHAGKSVGEVVYVCSGNHEWTLKK